MKLLLAFAFILLAGAISAQAPKPFEVHRKTEVFQKRGERGQGEKEFSKADIILLSNGSVIWEAAR